MSIGWNQALTDGHLLGKTLKLAAIAPHSKKAGAPRLKTGLKTSRTWFQKFEWTQHELIFLPTRKLFQLVELVGSKDEAEK